MNNFVTVLATWIAYCQLVTLQFARTTLIIILRSQTAPRDDRLHSNNNLPALSSVCHMPLSKHESQLILYTWS